MVILATEVGDRTFFIAAIMAMRHPRFVVWGGAVGALIVMTALSTVVGHVAPLLVSRTYTQYAAAALFLFFGVRMLRDGFHVEHAGASEELDEVEAELTKKQVSALLLSSGSAKNNYLRNAIVLSSCDSQEDDPGDEEVAEKPVVKEEPLDKVLLQAFTLTFLAEWGDRSQIATVALVRVPHTYAAGGCIGPVKVADAPS